MSKREYPPHIYDPQRMQLAAEVTQKELRKLLRSLPGNAWDKVDHDVVAWTDGIASELAPIHDFWNGCEGITQGFKLKRLVRYFSAGNIAWQTTDINLDLIPLGWPVGTLEQLGKGPWTAPQIRQALRDPEFARINHELSDQHAASSAPRDHYPIIVARQKDAYTLLDGNRRVMRAILGGQETLTAHIGTIPPDQKPREFWVSTPFLRNLVQIGDFDPTPQTRAAIETTLASLFKQSSIARINYRERVISQSDFAKELYEKLTQ